ncbi:MAG: glycosyltransferase [Elusimicrobia bacterium]|nr:glycosyltransferase [Elusimicrobiota bacterium]
MKNLVFIGSHLGYPMDRTPLGGGAMVGLHLARHWAADKGLRLALVGSGPELPAPGAEYVRLAAREEGLVHLRELDYARFCRDFERQATEWLLSRRGGLPPRDTAVVVNDVSEGPDLAALAEAGYPLLSIWHVDVVDYFAKLYLGGAVAPERLTRAHERLRSWGGGGLLPDVLRLVFDKQRETVLRSRRMITPSRAMADTLTRCYAGAFGERELRRRLRVVPWGAWPAPSSPDDERRAAVLRAEHGIGPETFVLMTLSRVSPEKGLHLLLEALRRLAAAGRLDGRDTAYFLCGEPAFMRGVPYMRRVRRAAARLRRVRVFFPGYLDAASKRAYLRLPDLFVSPSIHESYGLNVVEAMAAGLPVLASDHYGARDSLPPEAGRLIPFRDPAKAPPLLAGALLEMMSDRTRLKAMGAAAAAAAKGMPFSTAAETIRDEALGMLA